MLIHLPEPPTLPKLSDSKSSKIRSKGGWNETFEFHKTTSISFEDDGKDFNKLEISWLFELNRPKIRKIFNQHLTTYADKIPF